MESNDKDMQGKKGSGSEAGIKDQGTKSAVPEIERDHSNNTEGPNLDPRPQNLRKAKYDSGNSYFFWVKREAPVYLGTSYTFNLKEQAEMKQLKEKNYTEDLKFAYLTTVFQKIRMDFSARFKVLSESEKQHVRHLGLYKAWQNRQYCAFEKMGIKIGLYAWLIAGGLPIAWTFSNLRKMKHTPESKAFKIRMRFGFLFSFLGNFWGSQLLYYNVVIVPGYWKYAVPQAVEMTGLRPELSDNLLEVLIKLELNKKKANKPETPN